MSDIPADKEEGEKKRGGWRGNPNSLKGLKQFQERGGAEEVAACQAGPGELDLLATMEHVFANPKSKDRTEGQKNCRAWMEDNRQAFMAKLMELQRERRGLNSGAEGSAPEDKRDEADAGTEKAEELLERLLAEWEQAGGLPDSRPSGGRVVG